MSQLFPSFDDLVPLPLLLDMLPCLDDLLFPAGDGRETVIAFWLFIFRTVFGVSNPFFGDVSVDKFALLLTGATPLRSKENLKEIF